MSHLYVVYVTLQHIVFYRSMNSHYIGLIRGLQLDFTEYICSVQRMYGVLRCSKKHSQSILALVHNFKRRSAQNYLSHATLSTGVVRNITRIRWLAGKYSLLQAAKVVRPSAGQDSTGVCWNRRFHFSTSNFKILSPFQKCWIVLN